LIFTEFVAGGFEPVRIAVVRFEKNTLGLPTVLNVGD
jgi:hypothetical protein